MAWIARLPFRLPPTKGINAGGLELGDVKAELIVVDPWHFLVVRDIATERQARELVHRLAGALRWFAIDVGWGIEVRDEIQKLKDLGEEGAAKADIRGLRYWGDGHRAVVYSDDQRVGLTTGGEVSLRE